MHYLAIYLFTHWLLFSSRSHRHCRWKASWSRCTRLVFNYIMLLVRKKTIIDNNFVVFSTENNYPYLYWVFRVPIYFENEPLRPGYLTKPRIQLSPEGYSPIFVYEGRVFLDHSVWSSNGYRLCPFWSGIRYGFRRNTGVHERICRFSSK